MVIDKANFQAKMALKCGNLPNSVAILGRAGADKLVGKGQMILDSPGKENKRLQGSYITKNGIEKLLSEIKESFEQRNENQFILKDMELVSTSIELDVETSSSPKISPRNLDDEKLPNAIMWSLSQKQIANSRLQEYLKIGNTKANRILKRMEALHLIERLHGNLGWAVLPECIENMSVEAIRFLGTYGHTETDINDVLLKRASDIANI